MANTPKLLPCPFCGGQPSRQHSGGDERDGYAENVSYVCSGCGCSRGARGNNRKGGYADNSKVEQYALGNWNIRYVPEADNVRLISVADDMSTCTLANGDGQGYFYDRIDADVKDISE